MKKQLLAMMMVLLTTAIYAIDVKPLNDRCVVKYNKEWYQLKTHLSSFEGHSELQRQLSKALFEIEDTSIQHAYQSYVNRFETIKNMSYSEKAKGNKIMISLLLNGKKNRYVSFDAVRVVLTDKMKQYHTAWIIYDETKSKILTPEDIIKPEHIGKFKDEAQGAELQFLVNKDNCFYGYMKAGEFIKSSISHEHGDSIFTDNFKTLIKYELLKVVQSKRDSVRNTKNENISQQEVDLEKIYEIVEKMPKFPHEEGSFDSYVYHQIRQRVYQRAADKDKDINMNVTFVVERDGSISNATVLTPCDPKIDKEIIRILNGMPKWTPGMQKGGPVRVKCTAPIRIRVQYVE